MTITFEDASGSKGATGGPTVHGSSDLVEELSAWLQAPASEVDRVYGSRASPSPVWSKIEGLNRDAMAGDADALHKQQLLLSRLHNLLLNVNPEEDNAEGSLFFYSLTLNLEQATAAAEDARLTTSLDALPEDPATYVSWLKRLAKDHRVYKHPYYTHFIRDAAGRSDMRRYMIQESVIDGRFDDLLAMMQVGVSGAAKLEIAENFWDEMGRGDPEQVHTTLFNQVFDVFEVEQAEMEKELTGTALLTGNLAVMLCRSRRTYPEAVGYLGMTEWLAPDRFVNVVKAWRRLGLPSSGIEYHDLHIGVDSRHAAGWFHNVVQPAAQFAAMRRKMTRGSLWRLNSSARYLDERLAEAAC